MDWIQSGTLFPYELAIRKIGFVFWTRESDLLSRTNLNDISDSKFDSDLDIDEEPTYVISCSESDWLFGLCCFSDGGDYLVNINLRRQPLGYGWYPERYQLKYLIIWFILLDWCFLIIGEVDASYPILLCVIFWRFFSLLANCFFIFIQKMDWRWRDIL